MGSASTDPAKSPDEIRQFLDIMRQRTVHNPDSCLKAIQEILDPVLFTGDSALISSTYYWMGMSYRIPEGTDLALVAVMNASNWAPSAKHKMAAKFAAAAFYTQKNMLDSALAYHHQSFQLALAFEHKWGMFSSYIGIGDILLKKGQAEEALAYFRKALSISESDGFEPWSKGLALTGLAGSFKELGHDSAAFYAGRAVDQLKYVADVEAFGYLYFDALVIAHRVALQNNDPDLALSLLEEIETRMMPQSNSHFTYAREKVHHALHTKNFALAKTALEEAQEVDNLYLANAHKGALLEDWAAYFEGTGDLQNALLYLRANQSYQDSLAEADRVSKASFYSTMFDVAQLNYTANLLQVQNRELALRLDAEKRVRMLLIGLALLVALMLLASAYAIRQRNRGIKKIRKLYKRNLEQNEQLENALAEKEVLLQEIHHRVRNNFQVVAGLIDLNASKLSHMKEVADTFHSAQTKLHTMSEIHAQLYHGGNLYEVDFCAFLQKIVPMIVETYLPAQTKVAHEIICEKVHLPMRRAITLGLIVQEGLSNALEHGFLDRTQGKIDIHVKKVDDNVHLCIRDDGVGMATENPENLRLLHLLARQLKGLFTLKNKDGTEINISFKAYGSEEPNNTYS